MINGINQNVNPESIPEGFVYWAKNGSNNYKADASINENGNKIDIDLTSLNIQFKNGVAILGHNIILFYKSLDNKDEIAVIDEIAKTFTIKVSRTDFNFQIDKPIIAKAKLNSKNQLIVAFVDGNNTDKYVNLDTVSITDALNFYNLFPIVNNASSITSQILSSGSVTTGAYLFTFQYIAKDRSRSVWTTISNPIYITTIDETKDYTATKGNKTGLPSNKSIKVVLHDIDTTYQKVAIAVISKINGVISSKIIKEVFITTSDLTFIYNGTESIGIVTIEELVSTNVNYKSSKNITTINDQLFLADLTVPITENFQTIANQTVIRWRSTLDLVDKVTVSSKYKAGNRKTFPHDEVIAVYIQYELIDGSFTSWYHIPGRIANIGDTNDTGLATGGLQINGRTPKKYEIEDTCIYDTLNGDGSKSGIMGFWQNENEFYPSNFADFAGQNVRHHKLPSIGYLFENVWGVGIGYKYGVDVLDFLDIEALNVAYDETKIKGYRIGYAEKTLSDISVLGCGLTKFSGKSSIIPSTTIINPAGNFIVDSINEGGAADTINPNKTYLRFNSFDIFQDRPSLDSSYLRNYIKLKAYKLANNAPGNYVPTDSEYGLISAGKFFDSDSDMVAYIPNYTKADDGSFTKVINSIVTSNDKVRKLSSQSYIPNGVKYLKDSISVDNRGSEETIHAKIEGADLNLSTVGVLKTKAGGQFVDPTMGEETYLAALKNPKSDFYIDYENKTIVVNPQIIRSKTNTVISGVGDSFLGVYSYVSLCGYAASTQLDYGRTVAIVNVHVGVFRHNVNLRYVVDGDYSSYFYSDSGLFINRNVSEVSRVYWFSPIQYDRNNPFNVFQYHKDYSLVNTFETFNVFNPEIINQNDYNFRIARSTKSTHENSLDDGWRTFKLLDYFDTVRDKGKIINLEAWGTDALLIHHERALFKTRDKAVLQTNIIAITLGSGDIFAIEPKEENPTPTGAGGTQHKYGCLLTEIGYFFVDEETKDVYLYDGNQLKDIRKGLFRFFQQYLDCKVDNPYNDKGLQIIFDNQQNRIILSQKADINFTVSFDLVKQEWSFSHDWTPDYMFNTRNNVYSFKGIDLYTHNIGDKGKFYGVVYPFYIDYVFNDNPTISKVLEVVNWISKYKPSPASINARKTITSITIWNDQATTGKIDIVTNETTSLFVDQNTKVVDEKWSFNQIFDMVVDPTIPFISSLLADSRPIGSNLTPPVWYDSLPLRGKYFIVRLEFDNIDNKELYLQECFPSLRKSNN